MGRPRPGTTEIILEIRVLRMHEEGLAAYVEKAIKQLESDRIKTLASSPR
jgi:hypothetical protein